MRFKISKLPQVKLPAVLYSLEWYNKYHDPTEKDIKALEDALRYAQKKNPFISWFIAVSNTESSTAVRYAEKSGTRGRPKIRVYGKKIKNHVHTGIMGNSEKSAYSVAKGIGESINKRIGERVTKIVSKKKDKKGKGAGAEFITYSFRQSNSFHTGGDFDFSQCKNDFYIEYE